MDSRPIMLSLRFWRINRIKESFDILKAPFRASPISTRGRKCGPNLWQQHHLKARDASQSATKGERQFTSIWDWWQNYAIYRQSQLLRDWLDAWVRYLDHIVHVQYLPQCVATAQRTKYAHTLFTQWQKQTGTTWIAETRVQGSKRAIENSTKGEREQLTPFIPISERKRWHNKIDPSLQGVPWGAEHKLAQNTSQKNIISHPPHPDGHQAHHGVVHLRPLRAGRNGISTVGRTINGQSNNGRNNLELAFFKEVAQNMQETGSSRPKTTSSTLSPTTRKSESVPRFVPIKYLYRSCWIWVSHSASTNQQPWVRRVV